MAIVESHVATQIPNIGYFEVYVGIWGYMEDICRYMKVYAGIWKYMKVQEGIFMYVPARELEIGRH